MSKNNPLKRKSPRIKEYDYSTPAYYFVTICTNNHKELFGNIISSKIDLTPLGKIVQNSWLKITDHFPHVELDYYCIMPNHFHGILILNPVEEGSPLLYKPTLSNVIGYFKYQSTKEINQYMNIPSKKLWQRSFYDRIIRNEKELYLIRRYIQQNPLKWALEKNCPENIEL